MKLTRALFVLALAVAIFATLTTYGQRPKGPPQGKGAAGKGQPGGGGPRGAGGGMAQRSGSSGNNLVELAQNDAVQKEIETIDEQLADIKRLAEEQKAERDKLQRPEVQGLSEEDREKTIAEARQRRQDLTNTYNLKLAEVLLPHQIKRLREISVQVRGVSALSDSDVAAVLKLTEDQKKKIEQVTQENAESLRSQSQELRGKRGNAGGTDREATEKKLEELRAEGDDRLLAVLTGTQKTQFAALKGEKFEMPEGGIGRSGLAGQRGPGAQKGAGGQKGPGRRPGAGNGQGANGQGATERPTDPNSEK